MRRRADPGRRGTTRAARRLVHDLLEHGVSRSSGRAAARTACASRWAATFVDRDGRAPAGHRRHRRGPEAAACHRVPRAIPVIAVTASGDARRSRRDHRHGLRRLRGEADRRAASARDSARCCRARTEERPRGRARILVVDDTPRNVKLLADLLEGGRGLTCRDRVERCQCALAACPRRRGRRPDLVAARRGDAGMDPSCAGVARCAPEATPGVAGGHGHRARRVDGAHAGPRCRHRRLRQQTVQPARAAGARARYCPRRVALTPVQHQADRSPGGIVRSSSASRHSSRSSRALARLKRFLPAHVAERRSSSPATRTTRCAAIAARSSRSSSSCAADGVRGDPGARRRDDGPATTTPMWRKSRTANETARSSASAATAR